MPTICPTVTAETPQAYNYQIEKISKFVSRVHIDLMDGDFTPNKSPEIDKIWWPAGLSADLHIMFRQPLDTVKKVLSHQPNLIIVQAEADGDFDDVYKICRDRNVKTGIALLPSSDPQAIKSVLSKIEHVMIFSGNLGFQGGSYADLNLLSKVTYLKKLKPQLEIGWDGGINDRNISELVLGGVDVLNVGGFIHKSQEPEKAYNSLFRIAEETGTT